MALHLLNSHIFEDDDDIFMNRAKLILERLIEISFEEDNSLFFPYPYKIIGASFIASKNNCSLNDFRA